MRVDFGMEKDRSRRFAMWTLMHLLGAAPDLDIAFKDEEDRDAARNFMELMERVRDAGRVIPWLPRYWGSTEIDPI